MFLNLNNSWLIHKNKKSGLSWKGDPEQECRTWLNIAEAEELNAKQYSAVKQSYLNAIDIASEMKNRRLQARGLESLMVAQNNYGETAASRETEQKLEQIKEKYDLDLDVDDEDSQGM